MDSLWLIEVEHLLGFRTEEGLSYLTKYSAHYFSHWDFTKMNFIEKDIFKCCLCLYTGGRNVWCDIAKYIGEVDV